MNDTNVFFKTPSDDENESENVNDQIHSSDARSSADIEKHGAHIVEKILKKRSRKHKLEYFLKWKHFSDEHNTWEPQKNLNCVKLINEFEKSLKVAKKKKKIKANEINTSDLLTSICKPMREHVDKVPEKIISVTKDDQNGTLYYFMKWKDLDEFSLVMAEEVNIICPKIVLNFYEERFNWLNP